MYIPKNKIKTNLYSNGIGVDNPNSDDGVGPLVNSQTNEIYIGYYWKNYEGKFFTGKTPNDSPTIELIRYTPSSPPPNTEPLTTALYTPNFPVLGGEEYPYNESIVEDYVSFKQLDFTEIKLFPKSYYPHPTEDDYNLGVFTRYFCVKVNENIYLEIDKDTYDALLQEDETYEYALYTPFRLQWTLTGKENEVKRANFNVVQIREQRLKRRGLKEFLKGNYLKFYKS